MRFLLVLTLGSFAFGQNLPSLRWVQELDNLGVDTFAGIGTDAQGNIYVAGSTVSPNFPVKAAAQSYLGSAGLSRISGLGSAYTRLGSNLLLSALATDPKNPNVFYAVSSGTGVKTVDGGNTWTALAIPSTQMQQFAVDPSNDQNVYANAYDIGVLKSTDGGVTWNAINNVVTQAVDSPVSIWIDPNTSVVFAKSGTSLSRSADGGTTWQTVGPGGYEVALSFETPEAGVVYLFGGASSPLKSTDDGQTFQPVSIPVNSIFADPNHPGRLVGNGSAEIFESDDDGVTWTLQLQIDAAIEAADWANGVLYGGYLNGPGVLQISSDLKTVTPVGPPYISSTGLVVSGGQVYVPNGDGRNVFVTKLDPLGNVIYSTYFGGSGDDPATAMAVDASGNVYVAGSLSGNFPATSGTYSTAWSQAANNFLFKLNPDGSVAYSTYFPAGSSAMAAIAVDGNGSVYLTGPTNGGLPTTPGAYQTICGCSVVSAGFFAVPKPELTIFYPDAFLTKFDPAASTLVYSTYMGVSNASGRLVALGTDGSAYIASGAYSATTVYRLNAAGSSLLATGASPVDIDAMALATDGSLYLAGFVSGTQFQPTAGAFQTKGPPPVLPAQGSQPSAIVKMDAPLQTVVAATYFGGSIGPRFEGMAIDAEGNIYVGGGGIARGVPTRTPLFGAFGPSSGLLAELTGDLSTLLFSTYLGDTELFAVQGVALGSAGNVAIAGTASGNTGPDGLNPFTNVYVNSLALTAPPALRIDAILNAGSVLDGPLSAGETIFIRGAGFGSGSQLMIGGVAVPAIALTATQITAVVPSLPGSAAVVQVQSGGAASNEVVVPVATASPGIFSADGSGTGPAYILNQNGTLNTPSNPAAPGEMITIYATGVGPVSFTDGYAVTGFPANVFVDGFFCDGVAAVMGPVTGFPGSVYQITVYVPNPATLFASNPNLQNFVFPLLVGVTMQVAGGSSQVGLSISIGQ